MCSNWTTSVALSAAQSWAGNCTKNSSVGTRHMARFTGGMTGRNEPAASRFARRKGQVRILLNRGLRLCDAGLPEFFLTHGGVITESWLFYVEIDGNERKGHGKSDMTTAFRAMEV